MLSVRGWIVPDCRLCRITEISVCHEQIKCMELIYIPCKLPSNYFTSISSCFIYLVSSQRLNKESCCKWHRNCNAACLPLKEPAMITNRTTPTLIIVNRLFTVDDSFTPSASATEIHRTVEVSSHIKRNSGHPVCTVWCSVLTLHCDSTDRHIPSARSLCRANICQRRFTSDNICV